MVDTRGKPEVIPLYLSRPLADRTLRIMHALLTEAEGRGYAVEAQSDLKRGEAVHRVAIVIRCRAFPLALTERTTKVPHEPTPQERNPWTRLPKYDEEFNGRLALGAPTGSWYQHSYSYSDGGRWTLESRLGHLLQDLERIAAKADRREQEKELREAEQRRRWYAAVARAALVCRTTVAEDQQTYRDACAAFPELAASAGGVRLLHSRYPADVRAATTVDCEAACGKSSPRGALCASGGEPPQPALANARG